MSGRAPLWLVILLCAIVAPLIGWLDLRQADLGSAIVLFVCGAAIAWLQPRYAWIVALMLGLSIVETQFIVDVVGTTTTAPTASRVPALLALIPSSLGAAAGALLGVASTSATRRA